MRRPALSPLAARTAPWGWALWGAACGLLLALVLLAPAQWLALALARASHGQLQLAQPEGSVWTGSARLELTGGQDSRDQLALPGRLHWQLRPSWGGLRLALSADCCTTQPWQVDLQLQGASLQAQVQDGPPSLWPAELLTGLGAPWNTLQVQGQLRLSSQGLGLQWGAGRLQLQGQVDLQLQDVRSRLSTLRPLGSYRLVLQGGASPTLNLSTLDGSSLLLSGEGRWVGARLRFSGEASAAPGREAVLDNLLNIMGRRKGARTLISLG